jgi:predicted RNA binding protein YcfA (HicA-like mRNA interferase family)
MRRTAPHSRSASASVMTWPRRIRTLRTDVGRSVGERFPALKASELEKIVRRVCGAPVRQAGSHKQYASPNGSGTFTFAWHGSATVSPHMVRQVLTRDLGLTKDEAKAKVGM